MAEEAFTAYFANVTFAPSRPMAVILNSSPNELIRVYRVGISGLSLAAVGGVQIQFNLNMYTSVSAGAAYTPITPAAHRKSYPPLESVLCYANGEITLSPTSVTGVLRRILWSGDEANIGGINVDEVQCLFDPNIIYQGGLLDTSVQPLTLRAGQALAIVNITGTGGILNSFIEFTREMV